MDEGYGMKKTMSARMSEMVHEDFSKPSNLPTEVIQKMYPKTGRVFQDYDYDTLQDANICIDQSADKANANKKKYGRY